MERSTLEPRPEGDAGGTLLTRKQLLAGVGAAGLAAIVAACTGEGGEAGSTTPPPPPEPAPSGAGVAPASGDAPLAPGMLGGPVGFEGAERYQYPPDSAEGRAIEALRRLRRDGRAPETLVVQTLDFARPQWTQPFPEQAGSLLDLFEEETGIAVELVDVDPRSAYQENLRNASAKDARHDVVTLTIEEVGDLAEAGLLLPLDELVETYGPDWSDPRTGFVGGESAVSLFTRYRGSTYVVSLDNDAQPFVYRGDLLDDPAEQQAFEDRYGRRLRFPLTWDEHAQVAAFFTRPDEDLYGDVSTLAPFWCAVNWYQRFVCSASPGMLYFNPDGSANVDNEAGVRAFEELLRSLEWHPPGALSKIWPDQYALMGGGNAWGGGSSPNQTKLVPGNPAFDTAGVGRFLRSDVQPGRVVGGALVRRSVVFYSVCYGVNAFADPGRREAAYLFLQWAGAARVHTWSTFNPSGYQDPLHAYTLADPYVAESYKPQPLAMLGEVMLRAAPPITIAGGSAYRDSLSEELQRVLTRQQSPEQAARSLRERWDRITESRGVETVADALATLAASFPRVADPPGRELAVAA